MYCGCNNGAAGTSVPIHQHPVGGVGCTIKTIHRTEAAEAKHQSDSG